MYKFLWSFLVSLFFFIPVYTVGQTILFTQNWSNTSLISNNDDWSQTPGIEGFNGSDLFIGAGADPQTITGIGFFPMASVFANQTDPGTLTMGGVAEFDGIPNPTIALQPNSNNSAYAPYIIITLNTLNQTNINIAYNLRDLDGSFDNTLQPVALQYRIGNSGNFINVPAGFVADATTGPNLATLVTAVSAILPADANNKPLIQVRIITADAVGNDEWVGVDDINITGSAINPIPVVSTTQGTTTYINSTPVVIDNGITVTDANSATLAFATVSITNGFQQNSDALLFANDGATMGNINGSFNASSGVLSLSSAPQTATPAQWQAALKSIKFFTTNLPIYHTVTIAYRVNDGFSNSSVATKSVAVYSSAPPVITTTGGNANYMHNTPVVIDNGIVVTDANSSTLASATISFTPPANFQAGTDILSFTNNGSTMGNIIANYSAPTGVLSLTSAGATATLAQWQAALRSISFYSTINPQVFNRTVNFVVSDGTNNSIPVTRGIQIIPGPSPVVTTTAASTTYLHATPVIIDKGLTVADADGNTLFSASISIANGFEMGYDYLSFTNDGSSMGNISGGYSSGQGILSLTSLGATATLLQWQAALRSIVYQNMTGTPQTNNRIINFILNDGSTNSIPASKTITFMPLAAIAPSWLPKVQTLDPNLGAWGIVGQYNKMLIVNGNPAIAYLDAIRGNLIYRRATDALGTAFGPGITIDSLATVGYALSFQIVGGNPAIAYYDNTNQDLKFVRALDANGTIWGDPINVDVTGNVGSYASLQIVNNNPAIAYYDFTNQDLKFVRATNTLGSSWGTPLSVDVTGDVGGYASMQLVNGNPAIAYYDITNTNLKYIRAADISGNTWNSALTLDTSLAAGKYASLQVINGNPAIAYTYSFFGDDLKYIRANDASGTTWAAPLVIVSDFSFTGRTHLSLQAINGTPAISFYVDGSQNDLKYIRATDATGTTWGTLKTIDATGVVGSHSCLQVVNGNPAVSYYDESNRNLKYIRSTDASGTNWAAPLSIDSWGAAGQANSLQMVNGKPAFAFSNSVGIYYMRSMNVEGTSWGTPILLEDGQVGDYLSMQIINDTPAVAYLDRSSGSGRLRYVRANDLSGISWSAPITVDASFATGFNPSLFLVNGNPAIAYTSADASHHLKYIRANNASGSSWGTPIIIENNADRPQLQIINGSAAIVYTRVREGQSKYSLKYVRASDISGTTWTTPLNIDEVGDARSLSLNIINGKPAVAYLDLTSVDLKYITANDIAGTIWNNPVTVDAVGQTGYYTSLQAINNMPAIVYQDYDNKVLKYIAATHVSGTSWGTSIVLDASPNTNAYNSMIVSGNYMALVYFHQAQALPYFIPGRYGFNSLNTDYFRSKQNGNWNQLASWESSADNINWGNATLTPDFNANTITIKNGHTINVTANVTVDQLVLQPGGILVTKTGNNLIIQ